MKIRTRPTLDALRRCALAACLATALGAQASATSEASTDVIAPAGTIPVTSCADDGSPGTLRHAVDNANPGDTIDLTQLAMTCSTITLATGAIDVTVPGITLQGPGADQLAIDANYVSSVLRSKYGLTVSGLTITHGYAAAGSGGCIATSGDLTLSESYVTECQAGDPSGAANMIGKGGGVFVGGDLYMSSSSIHTAYAAGASKTYGGGAYVGGSAFISDSVFENDGLYSVSQQAVGGAVFASGTVSASASFFTGNFALSDQAVARGGAVVGYGNQVVLRDRSFVYRNQAYSGGSTAYGGGISAAYGTAIVISNSTVSSNRAESSAANGHAFGGGVTAFGSLAASYSSIHDNEALANGDTGDAFGGGLATLATGTAGSILLRNTTVSGNHATGGANGEGSGGGIATAYVQGSPFSAFNSTIAFNSATTSGGGIAGGNNGSAESRLVSTIVANNDAANVPEDIALGPSVPSLTIAGDNNLVMTLGHDVTLAGTHIGEDPQLESLTDDGASAPPAVHPLAADSPALDAGSNPQLFGCDQRGAPYQREAGPPDIGAYELQPHPEIIFTGDFELFTPCE